MIFKRLVEIGSYCKIAAAGVSFVLRPGVVFFNVFRYREIFSFLVAKINSITGLGLPVGTSICRSGVSLKP